MKRSPDLVRSILLKVEGSTGGLTEKDLCFANITHAEVLYHVKLLIEAGYVIAKIQYADNQVFGFSVERLTWAGHEFLDAARSDTIWKKAKERMDQTGGFVFDLAKPILLDLIKQQLGL